MIEILETILSRLHSVLQTPKLNIKPLTFILLKKPKKESLTSTLQKYNPSTYDSTGLLKAYFEK